MMRQIFNKIINQYFSPKKFFIELNIAKHEYIDFIMWCIEDAVKHGHFINIPKENIKKAIISGVSLMTIFIIKCNAIPADYSSRKSFISSL